MRIKNAIIIERYKAMLPSNKLSRFSGCTVYSDASLFATKIGRYISENK
jgi:hypothetical protein